MQRCYDDLKYTKLNSLSDLLAYFDKLWQKNWHDAVTITRPRLTGEHYRALGERLIETYYQRYAPFDSDVTIGTEMRFNFCLDEDGKYRIQGKVDRLSRTHDGTYQVHEYKPSAYPSVVGVVVALLAIRNQPADLGQYPDGRAQPAVAGSGARTARTYRTPVDWTLRDALKTPALWFLVIAEVCSLFLWHVVATQGPLHLQDRGFDPAMAAFFYSLAVGLSIMGRFTIAAVGDIIEPRFLFAFGAFCILLGGVLFWFVSPEAMWMAYLYPLLAGFGFGVAYVCFPTITGNYWGQEAFAGITGLISPISMTIHALVAPLAGFLYDLQGTYFTVMVISWIVGAVGLVAIVLCTPPRPKTK